MGNLKVFNLSKTWGLNLRETLTKIYSEFSQICVPFISKNYISKSWPLLEYQEALKRHQSTNDRFLLPVMFDNLEMNDMQIGSLGYVNAEEYSPKELAELIAQIKFDF